MKDSTTRFSIISILFHWTLAFTYIGLLGLGWYMLTLDYYDPNYTRLPHIHKSVGMLLVFVFTLHLAWRALNKRPGAVETLSPFERTASTAMHWLLRTGVVVVLVSGYLITTADGSPVSVFDWFEIPATFTALENQEDIAGLVHLWVAWIIAALAAGHALAALKHHFVDRDSTLTRMLGFNRRKSS